MHAGNIQFPESHMAYFPLAHVWYLPKTATFLLRLISKHCQFKKPPLIITVLMQVKCRPLLIWESWAVACSVFLCIQQVCDVKSSGRACAAGPSALAMICVHLWLHDNNRQHCTLRPS